MTSLFAFIVRKKSYAIKDSIMKEVIKKITNNRANLRRVTLCDCIDNKRNVSPLKSFTTYLMKLG